MKSEQVPGSEAVREEKNQKKKVVIGMSGGVDSSVAAWLLVQQGYEVIGVTMQIWQEDEETAQEEGGCCGLSAVDDARRVAWQLKIPYYVMNFRSEFKNKVMDYFVEEYLHGRTPNPCIACNRYVKWESLLKRSMDIGADYIATGHYARVEKLENGRYALKRSATDAKDQTYALYNLTQEQLSHTLMPGGDYSKEEIRQMAEELGLKVAHKADSQEICFIPDHDYARFIEEEIERENRETQLESCGGCASCETNKPCRQLPGPGNFVDREGNILGQHQGITHYTIGQRKGLGLAMGHPVFVVEIRPDTNEVVIGSNEDVFTDRLICDKLNWMAIDGLHGKERDLVECRFLTPVRAVTPGQAVVFYDGDYVAGGGTIR